MSPLLLLNSKTKHPRALEVRYADIFAEIRQSAATTRGPFTHTWQLPTGEYHCEGSGCWKPAVVELRDRLDVALGRFCRFCADRTIKRLQRTEAAQRSR
jgi:hypothetical protein